MQYRTPESIYEAIINTKYEPDIQPFIEKLREQGQFSNRLCGLLDRLQDDDEFREIVLYGPGTRNEVYEVHRLALHEGIALACAARLIDPHLVAGSRSLAITVAPTAEELARRYQQQPLVSSDDRHDKINGFTDKIFERSRSNLEYLELVIYSPALILGSEGFSRSEFVMAYLTAAVFYMAAGQQDALDVSGQFLEIAGVTESELQDLISQTRLGRCT